MTMTDADADAILDASWPPPDAPDPIPSGRKCRHPRDQRIPGAVIEGTSKRAGWRCDSCGHVSDATRGRRGKQSRNYGNRAELAVARTYGGTKIGHAGGPVDVRGTDWNTQVKTHRRKPPTEWVKAFGAMNANLERMPRLLLRFVLGPGQQPDDYFVVRGSDWLAWHGKDGE